MMSEGQEKTFYGKRENLICPQCNNEMTWTNAAYRLSGVTVIATCTCGHKISLIPIVGWVKIPRENDEEVT
jgi:hypothetical protein